MAGHHLPGPRADTYGSDGSVATTAGGTGFEVGAEDEVTVPTGTYTALRLEESATDLTWVAEGVGLIKDPVWELVSFEE